MFWGAIFFVLVPRGKGESYFFDKYFFAQNDMNRINIWFGLLLDRINYGTLEIFSGHLVLNSVHNISNRGIIFFFHRNITAWSIGVELYFFDNLLCLV